MSKTHVDISTKVMEQIHERKIHMKPRIYFILGSVLAFVSLVSAFISVVFLFSLTRFALRAHGPMKEYRLEQLLSSFPWWAPLLGIVGLILGIWLLKKFDFSYKRNFTAIIVGIFVAIFLAVIIIDYFKLDDAWFRHGPMRGMMRQYIENQDGFQPEFRQRLNYEGRGLMMGR